MSRLREVTDDDLVRLHDLADALPENLASAVQREVERERERRDAEHAICFECRRASCACSPATIDEALARAVTP